MWHTGDMFTSGWHGLGMLLWLLIIALFILLLVKAFSKKREASSTAMDILDDRYAKGDISEEEYLTKKAELEK